jgi:translocator protein
MSLSFYQQPHILAAGAWLFVVILMGGVLTDLSPWYFALKQPNWKPPDWSFGVIWTTIFLCAAGSWHLAWKTCATSKQQTILATLFVVNGLLNILWSVIYFKLHRPDWSLIEAAFLWLSVLAILLFTLGINRQASLLMAPYLIWVSLAFLLNLGTVRLNGPFQ